MTKRLRPEEHRRFDLGEAECAKVNRRWGELGTKAPEPGIAVDNRGKARGLLFRCLVGLARPVRGRVALAFRAACRLEHIPQPNIIHDY